MPAHGALRMVIGACAALLFLGGIVLIAAGGAAIASGVWLVIVGGTGIVAIALERSRYRSEAAERLSAPAGPGGGEDGALESRFQRTEEAFIDPTSGRLMRVWLDPMTGERRYRAEG
jgi:hypothetical protein